MKFRVLWIAGAILAATAGQVSAAVLYGTTGVGGNPSVLYSIDPTTGATTLIGSVGFAINGLDYYGGVLYGTERLNGNLIRINTSTGAGTIIGPLGAVGGSPTELAIDSSGNAYSWLEPGPDDLLSVNLATGATTYVGESGIGTGAHGLAFSGGTLYLHNSGGDTYTIDTTTGAASYVGSTGLTAHHGDVNPDNGLYYGLSFRSNGMNLIDLATATYISTVVLDRSDMHTLAFVDEVSTSVPEPSTLTLMGLGGIGLVVNAIRRRRNATA